MARIAFVLPDLGGGGAERVAIHLAHGMINRGHQLDIVVLRQGGELEGLLPTEARLIDLASPHLRSAILPLRRYLRTEKPNAILAFMWPLTVVAIIARSLSGLRPRLVLADHCALSRQYQGRTQKLLKATVRASYAKADERVIVSSAAADDLAELSGIDRSSIKVIFNPVPPPENNTVSAEAEGAWPADGKRILTVGTLKEQKNHSLLLEAFALLSERQPAQLMILGDGPLLSKLKEQAHRLEVADRVAFPGFHKDAAPFYASADLFVLSSNYEGLPMVLVEALHAGLPIVSTDCLSGPAEILCNGDFGALVPVNDVTSLVSALQKALKDPSNSIRQQGRAKDFSLDRATEAYLDLLLPSRSSGSGIAEATACQTASSA